MSKTTPEEAIERAKKYYSACILRDEHVIYFEITPEKLAALIDEVRGVDAEPVATVIKRIKDGVLTINVEVHPTANLMSGTLLYTRPAPSQPAPPVPQTVLEILRLMTPYVWACVKFNQTPKWDIEAADAEVQAAFKPIEAALTALVEKNHELQFSLDGVNAMRKPLTEEQLKAIWQESGDGWLVNGGNPYLEFARSIEKAHGIEPQQGESHE